MFTKLLPALALAVICSVLTAAQTQQPTLKNAPEAAKPAATNPLALTDTEKRDLASLANTANELDRQLTARLRVALAIECQDCEEDYAIGLAIADARKFYREQVKPAQAAYLKRREEIQQAHDCLGCELKDGAFVRVPKAEAK